MNPRSLTNSVVALLPREPRTIDVARECVLSRTMASVAIGLAAIVFLFFPIDAFGVSPAVAFWTTLAVVVATSSIWVSNGRARTRGRWIEFGPDELVVAEGSQEVFRDRWDAIVYTERLPRGWKVVTYVQEFEFELPLTNTSEVVCLKRALLDRAIVVEQPPVRPARVVVPILATILSLFFFPGPVSIDGPTREYALRLLLFCVLFLGSPVYWVLWSVRNSWRVTQRPRRFHPSQLTLAEFMTTWSPELRPVELEAGRSYRYVDRRTIKDTQERPATVTGLLALSFSNIWLLASPLVGRFLIVTLATLTILSWVAFIVTLFLLSRQRPTTNGVSDVIRVTPNSLEIVGRKGVTRIVPRVIQTTHDSPRRIPFAAWEEYGEAGNVYRLDRRFLVEADY